MLEIVVETEEEERYVRPSADTLAELVLRIGGVDDRYLVLQRVPDLPGVFAQVWHENGGGYGVERRDGDQQFHTTADGPEEVIGALTGWARQEPCWDNGLTWSPLDLPPAPEAPPLDLADAEREQLENHVREELAAGYASRAQLAELAEEFLAADDVRPVSREQATALADRLWLERIAQQRTWQGETDPERLTRAFATLQESGITGRENFTCCRTCGQAEIGAEAGPGARGFVYFHSQCTESAAAGHGLDLFYGGFDGSAETTAAVGQEVVAALEAAGLSVVWNRDPDRAITLTPLDWRRRLVG
ncbi:MAG: DUF6891 domain-containing protein [Dermatophilaceae bacterium]